MHEHKSSRTLGSYCRSLPACLPDNSLFFPRQLRDEFGVAYALPPRLVRDPEDYKCCAHWPDPEAMDLQDHRVVNAIRRKISDGATRAGRTGAGSAWLMRMRKQDEHEHENMSKDQAYFRHPRFTQSDCYICHFHMCYTSATPPFQG